MCTAVGCPTSLPTRLLVCSANLPVRLSSFSTNLSVRLHVCPTNLPARLRVSPTKRSVRVLVCFAIDFAEGDYLASMCHCNDCSMGKEAYSKNRQGNMGIIPSSAEVHRADVSPPIVTLFWRSPVHLLHSGVRTTRLTSRCSRTNFAVIEARKHTCLFRRSLADTHRSAATRYTTRIRDVALHRPHRRAKTPPTGKA
jgi:hypothetical protein